MQCRNPRADTLLWHHKSSTWSYQIPLEPLSKGTAPGSEFLSYPSVLARLCRFPFQSQAPQKQQKRFAHISLHIRGMCHSRTSGPKPLHDISKHCLLFLMAASRYFFFNSMDFLINAWGTLTLLKCSILSSRFFPLRHRVWKCFAL